jgi:Tol biopolymer transport system component
MRAALAIAAVALVVVLPAAGSTPSARILFDEPHGSSFDLVEIDADATNYLDLTPGDQTFYVGDQDGSWSPDGSRIVFTSHRDSNVSTEIYVMDADGSNQQRLTHDGPNAPQNSSPEIFDYAPVSSPTGGTIAYLKSVHGAVDVWLMRPDGSDERPLTADGGVKTGLAWSPDGSQVTWELGGATLALAAAGGVPARLAAGVGLAWSPDAARFAYVTGEGLWVARADGSDPARIAALPAATQSWSPDGARIAFVGTRIFPELASPKFGPPARQDVFAVRPDGTDLRRLTGPHGDGYAFGASGQSPTWWPDGSRLFFDSQRQVNEGPTTYVMNADGSCEGRFGQAPIRLQRPVWRPGSQPGLGPIMCSDLRVMALPSGGYVGPAALGQASPFRFEIDNDGSETATGVRVELKSTANVELLDGNGGTFPCTGPRLDLVCALPLLAPARGLSVSFLVRSPVAGTFPFSLSVSALEPDSDPSTNTLALSTQVLPCDKVGTYGDDILYGTPGPDRICALPGADRVYGGGGNDYLDAGNGADVVAGGPGRDTIIAKGGNDTIYARDGQKDWIDCGTERDVAIVDRLDVVRRCETVVQPKRR